jgi:hypothetical protein
MATKFKIATKTKFTYVAKKTLVHLRTYGQFNCVFNRIWAEKIKKIFGSSKIKNGPSIPDEYESS